MPGIIIPGRKTLIYPDPAEVAAINAAIATHAGLSDPHTGYRLESADHSHQSTGLQGGQIDHGLALTGLADDDHAFYPKGVLGLTTTATNQTGISTITDITNGSVTVTVAANRRLKITGSVRVVQRTGLGSAFLDIRESSTTLDRAGLASLPANEGILLRGSVIVVAPSAGSHTYKLSLATTANTVDTVDGANFPHWILVEDIGPS